MLRLGLGLVLGLGKYVEMAKRNRNWNRNGLTPFVRNRLSTHHTLRATHTAPSTTDSNSNSDSDWLWYSCLRFPERETYRSSDWTGQFVVVFYVYFILFILWFALSIVWQRFSPCLHTPPSLLSVCVAFLSPLALALARLHRNADSQSPMNYCCNCTIRETTWRSHAQCLQTYPTPAPSPASSPPNEIVKGFHGIGMMMQHKHDRSLADHASRSWAKTNQSLKPTAWSGYIRCTHCEFRA